jgi:hypothetical protein
MSPALWYNALTYSRIFEVVGLDLFLLTNMCITANSDKRASTSEDVMNWSMYTADRTTHLKIVVVGLSAALLISVISIAGQQFNLGTDIITAQGPTVIKAGAPVIFSDRSLPVMR